MATSRLVWRMASRVIGVASLEKKLKALGPLTRKEIKVVIQKSADEMVAFARSLAPVDTGALRESIHSAPGRHDLAIEVMAGGAATTKAARAGFGEYDYSLGTEWGNSEVDAQPFFWPSYRSVKKRANTRTKRAVNKAARAAAAMGGSA